MKTLSLIAILALSIHAQQLISADGAKWKHVATGKPAGGAKFDLYVKLPLGGTRNFPELTVKTQGGPESVVKLDCEERMFKAQGGEWVSAPRGSMGGLLIKWACKK